MGIGVVLILTALILAIESKSLLIGESADPKIVNGIRAILGGDERIITVNEVATLHMGPDFIVATISVDFVDALTSTDLEQAVTQLTRTIKATDPRIKRVFIEAERQLDHHKGLT